MCRHERVLIELKRHLTKFVPGEDHYAKDKILKALANIEIKVADEMQFEAQKEKYRSDISIIENGAKE